jgi:hypothetical protein
VQPENAPEPTLATAAKLTLVNAVKPLNNAGGTVTNDGNEMDANVMHPLNTGALNELADGSSIAFRLAQP